MTDGKIDQKQAMCHGYKMIELSNRDVLVINPAGLPIARTTSFREAVKIVQTDVKYFNSIYTKCEVRTDGTEDPFQ